MGRECRHKISKISLEGFFVCMGLITPTYLETMRITHLFFQGIQYLAMGILFVRVISNKGKIKKIRYYLLLAIMEMWMLFSTFINQGLNINAVKYAIIILLGVIYLECFKEKDQIKILTGFRTYLTIIISINFLTILAFPNGLYEGGKYMYENYYFLGHNNTSARIMIPAIVLSCFVDIKKEGDISIFSKCLTLICMISVIITWSNASMVSIGILTLFVLLSKLIEKKISRLSGKIIFLIPIILFVILVIVGRTDLFLWVARFFGKDSTFSGRIYIWRESIDTILKRWTIGYGYGANITNLGVSRFIVASAHNFFLDLLMVGGAIYFGLQLIINWIVCHDLQNLEKQNYKIKSLMSVFIISYSVLWQFSVFTGSENFMMYIIFGLCIERKSIANNRNEKRQYCLC